MKIKYVGVKDDGETAFSGETRIAVWFAGDEHDIADEALAERMLRHPDVFERADEAKQAEKADKKPEGDDQPLPALTAEYLASLSDEQRHEESKARKLGVHHTRKGDELVAEILAKQAEKAQA